MKCVYHPGYAITLPPGHPFPISKSEILKEIVLREGLVAGGDLLVPEPIDLDSLALIHTREYLAKLDGPGLSGAEQRRLGLPWSDALWLRSRLATRGKPPAGAGGVPRGVGGAPVG